MARSIRSQIMKGSLSEPRDAGYEHGFNNGAYRMLALVLDALRDHGNYTPGTHPTLFTYKEAADWIEAKVKENTDSVAKVKND